MDLQQSQAILAMEKAFNEAIHTGLFSKLPTDLSPSQLKNLQSTISERADVVRAIDGIAGVVSNVKVVNLNDIPSILLKEVIHKLADSWTADLEEGTDRIITDDLGIFIQRLEEFQESIRNILPRANAGFAGRDKDSQAKKLAFGGVSVSETPEGFTFSGSSQKFSSYDEALGAALRQHRNSPDMDLDFTTGVMPQATAKTGVTAKNIDLQVSPPSENQTEQNDEVAEEVRKKRRQMLAAGFNIGVRDPDVLPSQRGNYMVRSPDGVYAQVGDNVRELIERAHLFFLKNYANVPRLG